jgi:hypothetical protein
MYKKLCLFFIWILAGNSILHAQTIFSFSSVNNTKSENAGAVHLANIVADIPSAKDDTFNVIFIPGNLVAPDINNFSTQNIIVPAGTDSFSFFVSLTNDIIVEHAETAIFVLRAVGAYTKVGSDSIVSLTVSDDEIPADIGFLRSKDTLVETASFYNIKVVCNNPNPTTVRVYIRADDLNTTLTGGPEFTFNWQFLYFPPGLDTQEITINLFDDFVQEPVEYVTLKMSDFEANDVIDSAFVLYVLDDETPLPLYISYISPPDTVWEDTAGFRPVNVEIYNPYSITFSVQLVRDNLRSTAATTDYYFNNPTLDAFPGYNYYTVFIEVFDDELVEGTETAFLTTKYEGGNLSADSTYTLYVIDKDTVRVGFLGAAFSFLEDEGKCAIKLTTSSPVPFDIAVPVYYHDGNATPNVDFVFNDTVVVFSANASDTQMVFIYVVEDDFKEMNEQVNLRIGNIAAPNVKTGVVQFTFFIIDNDTFAVNIDEISERNISIYPNPAALYIKVESEYEIQQISLMSLSGARVFFSENPNDYFSATISVADLTSGVYIAEVITSDGIIRRKLIRE